MAMNIFYCKYLNKKTAFTLNGHNGDKQFKEYKTVTGGV